MIANNNSWMISFQIISLVLFFIFALIWIITKKKELIVKSRIKSLVEPLFFASLLSLAMVIIGTVAGQNSFNIFLDFPIAVALLAIGEELFFRGTATDLLGEYPSGLLFSMLMPLVYSFDFQSYLELVLFFALIFLASNSLRKRCGITFAILFRILLVGIMFAQNQFISFSIEMLLFSFPLFYLSNKFPDKPKKWFENLGITLKDNGLLKQILQGIGLAVLVFTLIQIEGIILTPLGLQDSSKVASTISTLSIFSIVIVGIVSPVAEEMFFRGFLQSRIGLISTSIIFALVHLGYSSVVEFLAAFTAALIFGLFVEKQKHRGIFPTVIAHAIINITAILIVFLH